MVFNTRVDSIPIVEYKGRNPCFNGIWFLIDYKFAQYKEDLVAILVLMEYGF